MYLVNTATDEEIERVGEEITNINDIQLFEQIKNNLNGILLAKHYIRDRLSSEFNIFVM